MRAEHPVQLAAIDTLWFGGIAGINLGLAYLTRRWVGFAPLTLPAAVAVFIATALGEYYIILYEDDWWDDFRGHKRLLVLMPLAQIAAVGGGWWMGWWIAG